MYAEKLEQERDRAPLYNLDIFPGIDVYKGIGAVGIGLMFE